MNIAHACKLLQVVQRRPNTSLIIRGRRNAFTVLEMARLGLVNATLPDGNEQQLTMINGVTEAGQKFLRALHDQSFACRADRAA